VYSLQPRAVASVLEVVLVFTILIVVGVAVPVFVVAVAVSGGPSESDLFLDGFVRSIEQAVAVTSFVSAAGIVLTCSALLLNVARVIAEQVDVVAGESAVSTRCLDAGIESCFH
jgi:hypothetical protein